MSGDEAPSSTIKPNLTSFLWNKSTHPTTPPLYSDQTYSYALLHVKHRAKVVLKSGFPKEWKAHFCQLGSNLHWRSALCVSLISVQYGQLPYKLPHLSTQPKARPAFQHTANLCTLTRVKSTITSQINSYGRKEAALVYTTALLTVTATSLTAARWLKVVFWLSISLESSGIKLSSWE